MTISEPENLPPRARRMDADEVMQVIVDIWRQRNRIDPDSDTARPLSRETSIERAMNLIGLSPIEDDWQNIAGLLEAIFRTTIDFDIWQRVIGDKKETTLGDVCDYLALYALAPVIEREFERVTLDWQAAGFRSILLVLEDGGADIRGLRPESKLAPMLRTNAHLMTGTLGRLHPGRIPALRKSLWPLRLAFGLMIFGLFTNEILPHQIAWPLLPNIGAGMAAAGLALIVLFVFRHPPPRLGELMTFHDLAFALTSPPPGFDEDRLYSADDGTLARWGPDWHMISVCSGRHGSGHGW